MDITVAAVAVWMELIRASLNRGIRKTAAISDPATFINMTASGQITVMNRNSPMSSLTIFERRKVPALIVFPQGILVS
jgi:hypothetical protein